MKRGIMNERKSRFTNVAWRVLGITSLLLLVYFALSIYVAINYPRPDRFELSRIAPGAQPITAFWPYGRSHQLILALPGAARDQPPAFTASIQFLEGNQLVTNLVFHSTNACSHQWPRQGVQGFYLIGAYTNWWKHTYPLVPGQRYSVVCDFMGDIPSNSSLWVWCIQSGIDRWKTKRRQAAP